MQSRVRYILPFYAGIAQRASGMLAHKIVCVRLSGGEDPYTWVAHNWCTITQLVHNYTIGAQLHNWCTITQLVRNYTISAQLHN